MVAELPSLQLRTHFIVPRDDIGCTDFVVRTSPGRVGSYCPASGRPAVSTAGLLRRPSNCCVGGRPADGWPSASAHPAGRRGRATLCLREGTVDQTGIQLSDTARAC